MNWSDMEESSSVYQLLNNLAQDLLEKECLEKDNLYNNYEINDIAKRLRVKTFEILLKKTPHFSEDTESQSYDPFVELAKHAFKLETKGRFEAANELNNLVDEIIELDKDNELSKEFVDTIRFFTCLKNIEEFESDAENQDNTTVFFVDKRNPALPDPSANEDGVVKFQFYPLELFSVPQKFEKMLGIKKHNHLALANNSSFISDIRSMVNIEIESSRSNCRSLVYETTPLSTPYFMPNIVESLDEDNELSISYNGIVSEPQTPFSLYQSHQEFPIAESCTDLSDSTSSESTVDQSKIKKEETVWAKVVHMPEVFITKDWENFGETCEREPVTFATENNESVKHLVTVSQSSYETYISKRLNGKLKKIPAQDFLNNVKLLLLGIESQSFLYPSDIEGFQLNPNQEVFGMSPLALRSYCKEVILFGNAYRALSSLVEVNSQNGRIKRGVIFEAMCTSIKEFLLFYQAAVLKVFLKDGNNLQFIQLLQNVRPIGVLIVEVENLCCGYNNNMCNLSSQNVGEGIGILTHIYKSVTKVTNSQVALVFYSILKSCCEVYFRFLQQWLFDGKCEDIYDEFMIKVRQQYVREKTHRFWSRAYAVNTKSVPGFLSGLTESILECGKAVSLLKICDPKNPICYVFSNCQPQVRLCLNISAIQRQMVNFEEYGKRGFDSLQPLVSMKYALADLHNNEEQQKRCALVSKAHQAALSKAKKEREEKLKQLATKNREYLAALRSQVDELESTKEKEKARELLMDKQMLEVMQKENERIKLDEDAKREKVLKYYNELAQDIENRRIRSDWRANRLKLNEDRIRQLSESDVSLELGGGNANESAKRTNEEKDEECELPVKSAINKNEAREVSKESSDPSSEDVNDNFDTKLDNLNVTIPTETQSNIEDENCNFEESVDTSEAADPNKNDTATRPTTLNIVSKDGIADKNASTFSHSEFYETDNFTAAQRIKLKVLRQEFGISPNNNTVDDDIMNWKTENDNDALRNRRKVMSHETFLPSERLKQIDTAQREQSDMERNRERNMAHTFAYDIVEKRKSIGREDHDEPMTCDGSKLKKVLSCDEDGSDEELSDSSNYYDCTPSFHNALDLDEEDGELQREDDSIKLPVTDKDLANCASYPEFIGFTPLDATATSHSSSMDCLQHLTKEDVDIIDNTSLQMYLEKSVTIPLSIQARLANAALIKHLLEEQKMLSHLHSLRSYFFLLNGEFAKSLTDSLYSRLYEVSKYQDHFNSATLTNILERALLSSLTHNYENAELLSLTATKPSSEFQVSNPQALDCLCLNYKVSWPLNIILSETIIRQYSKVFKFLIMIGRVMWVLQEDFHFLKTERAAATSPQYHKLQLYRHLMMQFINALHNYVTCSVLYSSWAEFEKDLETATSLDQICQAHETYIRKILSKCMLNTSSERVRSHLHNVFKIILKFHNRLHHHTWIKTSKGFVHPSFSRLEKMYETFCELRSYFNGVVNKLAISGYQPHLAHFLNALNINNRFDLSSKRNKVDGISRE